MPTATTDELLTKLISVMEDNLAYLKNNARDMQKVCSMFTEVTKYMKDAESEVSEKMRRFIMYMHDVHDVMNMYTEMGQPVPAHIAREAERCDDRFRHLLEDAHAPGATFDRVREEMTLRAGNRWDHSRLLPKQGSTP